MRILVCLFPLFLAALGFVQGIWFLRRPEQVIRMQRALISQMLGGHLTNDARGPIAPWEELLVLVAGVLSICFGILALLITPSLWSAGCS